jgi:flagellin
MALVVNTNVPSLNAQRNLGTTNLSLSKSLERLSSGLRINRAGDDAAGLAISEKLRGQVRGLNQAVRNANDGISLVQTAEGSLSVTTNIIQRLRELAVQSASDTNTASDRGSLKTEADLLVAELTRIGNTTEFNGKTLLNGTFASGKLQIGANSGQSIAFTIGDVRAAALGRRTTVTGDLDDTASSGINAGITAGELTVNGAQVVTAAADDQVSVLEIVTIDLSSTSSAGAGSIGSATFFINSVDIGVVESQLTASAKAAAIVSAITAHAASLTNVEARIYSGTAVVLTAKKGTDLKLQHSTSSTTSTVASFVSIIGLSASFIGSGTQVTTNNGQSSSLAKAAAINTVKSTSNVTAAAQTTTVTGTAAIAAVTINSADLHINGINIGAVTVLASDGSGTLVTAINAKTSDTGVTANVDTAGKLVLTAADGRNIVVTATAAVNTALGTSSSVTRSKVQLQSPDAITLAGTNPAELGKDSSGNNLTATTFQSDLSNALSTINISTQAGADSAILSLDAALEQVNTLRAQLGALQNRLESTVSNLSTTSENLSASESRIRDADFAAETARFTRNQILGQAGTAILAQANTLPQLALQLLR